MKQITGPLPEKHIFVCVNVREGERDHCSKVGGQEVYKKIKEYVLSHGMSSRIWVTKTGCQGFCNPVGTTITVYPEQKIFKEVKLEEVDKLLEDILKS